MSKILIVEDDSEIALLERDYLEIEGLESDVVSDGESAARGTRLSTRWFCSATRLRRPKTLPRRTGFGTN